MNPPTDIPILLLVFSISIAVFNLVGRRWPLRASLALALSAGPSPR